MLNKVLLFRMGILFSLALISSLIFFLVGLDPFQGKAICALGKKVLSSFFSGFAVVAWTITFILSLLSEDPEVILQEGTTKPTKGVGGFVISCREAAGCGRYFSLTHGLWGGVR